LFLLCQNNTPIYSTLCHLLIQSEMKTTYCIKLKCTWEILHFNYLSSLPHFANFAFYIFNKNFLFILSHTWSLWNLYSIGIVTYPKFIWILLNHASKCTGFIHMWYNRWFNMEFLVIVYTWSESWVFIPEVKLECICLYVFTILPNVNCWVKEIWNIDRRCKMTLFSNFIRYGLI
jgi:hypothetical protein